MQSVTTLNKQNRREWNKEVNGDKSDDTFSWVINSLHLADGELEAYCGSTQTVVVQSLTFNSSFRLIDKCCELKVVFSFQNQIIFFRWSINFVRISFNNSKHSIPFSLFEVLFLIVISKKKKKDSEKCFRVKKLLEFAFLLYASSNPSVNCVSE